MDEFDAEERVPEERLPQAIRFEPIEPIEPIKGEGEVALWAASKLVIYPGPRQLAYVPAVQSAPSRDFVNLWQRRMFARPGSFDEHLRPVRRLVMEPPLETTLPGFYWSKTLGTLTEFGCKPVQVEIIKGPFSSKKDALHRGKSKPLVIERGGVDYNWRAHLPVDWVDTPLATEVVRACSKETLDESKVPGDVKTTASRYIEEDTIIPVGEEDVFQMHRNPEGRLVADVVSLVGNHDGEEGEDRGGHEGEITMDRASAASAGMSLKTNWQGARPSVFVEERDLLLHGDGATPPQHGGPARQRFTQSSGPPERKAENWEALLFGDNPIPAEAREILETLVPRPKAFYREMEDKWSASGYRNVYDEEETRKPAAGQWDSVLTSEEKDLMLNRMARQAILDLLRCGWETLDQRIAAEADENKRTNMQKARLVIHRRLGEEKFDETLRTVPLPTIEDGEITKKILAPDLPSPVPGAKLTVDGDMRKEPRKRLSHKKKPPLPPPGEGEGPCLENR